MSSQAVRIMMAAVLVTLAAAAAVLVQLPHKFIPDDVYFYLTIADYLVDGQGSTFNGVTPTNGYHPLWMAVAVLERLVVGSKSSALLGLHMALTMALNGLAAYLYLRLVRRALPEAPGLGVVPLLAYSTYNALGSEFHLSVPLLLGSLLLAADNLQTATPSRARLASQGALMGLAALARLDNVFVLMALGAFTAWGDGPRRAGVQAISARALAIALPAAGVLLPYLLWNLLAFGHLVPISGSVKAGLVAHGYQAPLAGQAKALGALALGGLLLVGLTARARRQRWMLALACGACLHFAYIALGMAAIWTWYFAGELLLLAVTCDQAFAWLAPRLGLLTERPRRLLPWAIAAAIVFVMLPIVQRKRQQLVDANAWYLPVAGWFDAHVPEGEAIATTVSPGSQAFFSQRGLVALDGLTLDFAFFDDAAERGLYAALHDRGVRYVIAPGPRSDELLGLSEVTALLGHGSEGVGFFTAAEAPDTLIAVSAESPFSGAELGRLRTDDQTLVHAFPASDGRAMAVYRLALPE